MNWSLRPEPKHAFRFAVGSFIEEYRNKVQIIQLDDDKGEFVVKGTFDHPYPTTNIMWAPAKSGVDRDLLATTGDYLRLWNVTDDGEVRLESLLNNVRSVPSGGGGGSRRCWCRVAPCA